MNCAPRAWLITPQAPSEIWSGYSGIEADDLVVAVDGGLRRCKELGLIPLYLCGDLDSVRDQELQGFPEERIWAFPTDKDETDTELAMLKCLELGYTQIVICNDMQGRIDHGLGLIQNLRLGFLKGLDIRIETSFQRLWFLPPVWEAEGLRGCLLSLVTFGESAVFSHSEGLKWPLDGLELKPELSRGISNLIISERASIRLTGGPVLAILSKRG